MNGDFTWGNCSRKFGHTQINVVEGESRRNILGRASGGRMENELNAQSDRYRCPRCPRPPALPRERTQKALLDASACVAGTRRTKWVRVGQSLSLSPLSLLSLSLSLSLLSLSLSLSLSFSLLSL